MSFRYSSKLERRITRKAGAAVGDFDLIGAGDRILVAVSGGKDSLSMLHLLRLLRRRSPVTFELVVVTLDQGAAGFDPAPLEAHYREHGVEYRIEHVPINQILAEKLKPGTTPCALCSRIRRGALYTLAPALGCNKIALGHHLDDLVETLLLNLCFTGQLRAMAPIFTSDDGRNVVIRPLCYVPESWLQRYAAERGFPVQTCATEGCDDENSQRQKMKRLVTQLEQESPDIRQHMLRALATVRAEHLLDRDLLGRIGR